MNLPRLLLLLLGLLVASPSQEPADVDPAAGVVPHPVCVFLVRHAEKADDGTRDPGLTAEGEERARELARLLSRAGVTHLFASEFRRTGDTLAPLARASGLEVEALPARGVRDLARRLEDLPPGSVAVVAGHSNTVPALAALLGRPLAGLEDSPYGPVLPESEYGRLVQIVLGADRPPFLVEFHAGAR